MCLMQENNPHWFLWKLKLVYKHTKACIFEIFVHHIWSAICMCIDQCAYLEVNVLIYLHHIKWLCLVRSLGFKWITLTMFLYIHSEAWPFWLRGFSNRWTKMVREYKEYIFICVPKMNISHRFLYNVAAEGQQIVDTSLLEASSAFWSSYSEPLKSVLGTRHHFLKSPEQILEALL